VGAAPGRALLYTDLPTHVESHRHRCRTNDGALGARTIILNYLAQIIMDKDPIHHRAFRPW
jgi:hypothetical protein